MSDSDHVASGEAMAWIESWVTEVDSAWKVLGVPLRLRRFLAADLARDLEATAATGVEVDLLLDPDVVRFAQELAEANGFVVKAATPGRNGAEVVTSQVIWTALRGGLLGAVFSWFVVFPYVGTALGNASDLAAAITLDAVSAVITIVSAVAMVRWRYRARSDVKIAVLLRIAAGLSVGGLLSVAPTMLLARAWGYSAAPIVMLAEAALVAAFCAAGVAIAVPRDLHGAVRLQGSGA